LKDLDAKDTLTHRDPFRRFKVRVRKEIVSMGRPDIDVARSTGEFLSPEEFQSALTRSPSEYVLIDVRNDCESHIGKFVGAIEPRTVTFRDFPDWFRSNEHAFVDERTGNKKKILSYCTGGIRCVKATAFMKEQGFTDVAQLEGGIINYLQRTPKSESLFQGSCFVFDHRTALEQEEAGGARDDPSALKCFACRRPLRVPDDTSSSPFYELGVSVRMHAEQLHVTRIA
jgi:UPF0176 protein